MIKNWSKQEVNYLIRNYKNTNNSDLCLILNRTERSITKKSGSLGLKKTKEQISKNISRRNKITGRDLTPEFLKNIALKYKTRGEFQLADPSAYKTCLDLKIIDDACFHMLKQNYSIPQLLLFEIIKTLIPNTLIEYNNRKAIKPYELDIYIPEYKLAIEYNGKYWHRYNLKDGLKADLCLKSDITLLYINENTRNYVLDIKNQLIDNLELINNVCRTRITDSYVENIDDFKLYELIKANIINIKDIESIILKYANFSNFKKNEPKIYSLLAKNKLLNKYTAHLERDKTSWNIEKVRKCISKYTHYSDFVKNEYGCYIYVKKNKLDFLLENLIKDYTAWSFDKIKNLILKKYYKNISRLKMDYPGAVKYMRKNKLIDDCKIFINKNNKYLLSYE